MSGVDHLDLVVTSLGDSLDFYRGLLEPLGYTRSAEIGGERGERVVYLGGPGGTSVTTSVSLRERQSDAHAVPYDRYAVPARQSLRCLHPPTFRIRSRARAP